MRFIAGVHLAGYFPEVLTSVVEIDDLNSIWKVFGDQIPYPFGIIADDYFLFCPAPTPFPGFSIDSFAKLLGCLDGSGVGGGSLITNRTTFFVDMRLPEYATQFGFPRMGSFPSDLSDSSCQFGTHHGHTGAIHFDIQHRDLR